MAEWYDKACEECGDTIHVCTDWDRAPRFCKSCKEDRAAKWYDKSCEGCGTTIHVNREWDSAPKFCKACKQRHDAKWYDKSCEGCGTTIHVNREWDSAPRFCKSCKQRHDAKWYDKSCEGCRATIRVNREWDSAPKFCKECKERNDAKWYKRSCLKCSSEFRVHADWTRPPDFCGDCKRAYPSRSTLCERCDAEFTISSETQLRCRVKEWSEPRKCEPCRELFRHKPFRTFREQDMFGATVFRTYNSKGVSCSPSRATKRISSATTDVAIRPPKARLPALRRTRRRSSGVTTVER